MAKIKMHHANKVFQEVETYKTRTVFTVLIAGV